MNKLKPCPLCGGQVAYTRYSISREGRIKCPTCKTMLVFLGRDTPVVRSMEQCKEETIQCWNERKCEDEIEELQIEVLRLNQSCSNLYSALSTYTDEEEQLDDEIESIRALRKEGNKKMPAVCIIAMKVQVINEKGTSQSQRGKAQMKIQVPQSMLENFSLISLLTDTLSAALADYDTADKEKTD